MLSKENENKIMKAWGKRLQEENLKEAEEHREEIRLLQKEHDEKEHVVQREEYTVIQNPHLGYLIKHTNQYIKAGWRPQGGICVSTSTPFTFEYYQALIRSV